jgi:hypothetical protein
VSNAAVARLALGVSLAVAAWQVLQYVLSGARVRVRLRPGLLTDYALQRDRSWSGLARRAKDEGWPIEVAIIEVENMGRHGVTISDAAIDMREAPWWRPHFHRRVSPGFLNAPDAQTTDRARLEPFDRAVFVFDVWGVIAPVVRDAPRRPVRLRGAVRVAGKRWPRRSPIWASWRAVDGQVAFLKPDVEIGLAVYRSMWRWTHGHEQLRMIAIPVAIATRKEFPADGRAPSRTELESIIKREWVFDGDPLFGSLTAFYMARDLQPFFAEPPMDEETPPD